MEKDPRDVIIRPVITEHSYDAMENNVYTFEVAKDANKVEIRQAIEAIFNVKVVKVNTLNVKSKPKRVRYQEGRTRTWKKAMVTLAEGRDHRDLRFLASSAHRAKGRKPEKPRPAPAKGPAFLLQLRLDLLQRDWPVSSLEALRFLASFGMAACKEASESRGGLGCKKH